MQFDVYRFQKLFNEEYFGVKTKMKKEESIENIVDHIMYKLYKKVI